MAEIYRGYVVDRDGSFYVQKPARNQWGFSLFSDDQEFPGGFGVGEWMACHEDKVPKEVREQLDWVLNAED